MPPDQSGKINDEDFATRLRVIEVVLWGLDGSNGVRSEVRGVREAIQALDEKFEANIDALAKSLTDKETARRDKRRSNVIWAVGLLIMVLCAAIGAGATVLSQGGH